MTSAPISEWPVATSVSPQQVDSYREHGYLKFGHILAAPELDRLRVHIDQRIATLPDGVRPEQLDAPHFEDPFYFDYLAHPRILDLIEAFVGPDVVLWASHVIAKRSGDGLAVAPHQDGVLWQGRLDPMEVITIWLAIDASTIENGCMTVLPGSHRTPGLAHTEFDKQKHLFGRGVALDAAAMARAVPIELQPGQCSFHDAFTVHGSTANTSPKRRCGYTMRYMPAHVVHTPRPDAPRPHKLYLLRGQDRSGGRNAYTPLP